LMGLVLNELARYLPDAATREAVRIELLDGVRAHVELLRNSAGEDSIERTEATPEEGQDR